MKEKLKAWAAPLMDKVGLPWWVLYVAVGVLVLVVVW